MGLVSGGGFSGGGAGDSFGEESLPSASGVTSRLPGLDIVSRVLECRRLASALASDFVFLPCEEVAITGRVWSWGGFGGVIPRYVSPGHMKVMAVEGSPVSVPGGAGLGTFFLLSSGGGLYTASLPVSGVGADVLHRCVERGYAVLGDLTGGGGMISAGLGEDLGRSGVLRYLVDDPDPVVMSGHQVECLHDVLVELGEYVVRMRGGIEGRSGGRSV